MLTGRSNAPMPVRQTPHVAQRALGSMHHAKRLGFQADMRAWPMPPQTGCTPGSYASDLPMQFGDLIYHTPRLASVYSALDAGEQRAGCVNVVDIDEHVLIERRRFETLKRNRPGGAHALH